MSKKLKIHADFKNLIPPLQEEEFKQLEQNILSHKKCRDSIKTWRDYIVDGHNRYEICNKHNIPYSTTRLSFSSKEEAKLWIAENQLGRRNITKAARIELALTKAELLRDNAKHQNEHYNTRKIAADLANVSEETIYKYMQITKNGSDELVEQVKNGEVKIGTAHKTLHTREVTVLYDDSDVRFKNTSICHDNVMRCMGEISKIYTATDKMSLSDKNVLKLLDGHVNMMERVLSLGL
ncbi:MAG: hypothetical protein FWF78_10785 [Defluviitaleaceae bacterium]|nr:hypothetical protein [Defluviitaleaceae bacterium]